jgi:hypothetical protein
MIRRLLLLLLLLPWPGVAAAQQDYSGRWVVGYRDEALGPIGGTAFIDAETGQAEVAYKVLATGEVWNGRGTATPTETGVEISLNGAGPSAGAADLGQWGEALPGGAGETRRLWLGEGEREVSLAQPPPAESVVILTLDWGAEGRTLSGSWEQVVDPATGRDDEGRGRIGELVYAFDGTGTAVMRGNEAWRRPLGHIITAFTPLDQFAAAYGEPYYPHPFDAAGNRRESGSNRRIVFVLGRELPQAYRDGIKIESLDPHVEYFVDALPPEATNPQSDRYWFDEGWERLAAQLEPERLAQLKREDVMLLDARLRAGVTPGVKSFKLNGMEAAWLLQFGDYTGKLAIARTLGFDQTEPADYLFTGETIVVEIFLDHDRTEPSIPVFLGLGRPDGSQSFVKLDGKRAIPAFQDPAEPRRYRTLPIRLTDPEYLETFAPADRAIAVLPGEVLLASLGEVPIYNLRPALDKVPILQSPRHLKAALTGDPAARGRTWEEALAWAVECADLEAPDPETLTDEQADWFANVIAFAFEIMVTEVKVGEHAAALLIRDVFLDLMTAQIEALQLELDEKGLKGFRALVDGEIFGAYRPLGDIEVTAPDGGKTQFATSFVDTIMEQRYGLTGEALSAYQLRATIEARQLYAEAIGKARETVAEIDACDDIDDLLKVVGPADAAPVVQIAKHLAVRLEDEEFTNAEGVTLVRPAFVAHRQARAWFDRVRLVTERLQIQWNRSSEDTTWLLIGVSLASLPVALLQAPAALVAVVVIDTLDFVITAGRTIYKEVQLQAETRFALGASAVLGAGRYRAAEARRYEWVMGYFASLGAAAGAAFNAFQAYEGIITASQKAALARGKILAETVSLDELPRLTAKQQEELLETVIIVRGLAQRVGREALEEAEEQVAKLADEIADTQRVSAANKPVWAEHLSDELYLALGARARQPHVIALFGKHPREMARLLETPGAVELLTHPFDSLDDFAKAVGRLQSREGPQGDMFYYQSHPGTAAPHGFDIEMDTAVNAAGVRTSVNLRVYVGTDAGERNLASFKRLLEFDDTFEPGGKTLVLAYARVEEIEGVSTWITTLPFHLTERGVPIGMHLNHRAMLGLGIDYADQSLTAVKLSGVVSANTCVEMNWLIRNYPEMTWAELFRYTHSYRYTQSMLEQAGFKIDDVVIDEAQFLMPTTVRNNSAWYAGSDLEGFARRYGLGMNDEIDTGFDIYLKLSPAQ